MLHLQDLQIARCATRASSSRPCPVHCLPVARCSISTPSALRDGPSASLRHPAQSSCPAAPVQSRRSIRCFATQAASLPALPAVNDDFDKLHAFGDFAFWCVPGSVLVGAYPYMDHKQCTTYEQGEARLEKIIQDDITTFVSVQGELPSQQQLALAGKDGYMPYKATAELVKSAHSPPPSLEAMMGLRNATLNKFLPPKKRGTQETTPSYALSFAHYPLLDFTPSTTDMTALKTFVADVTQRLQQGEKVYLHCSDGNERASAVAACLLVHAFGLRPEDAVKRVERAYATRGIKAEQTSASHTRTLDFVKAFAKA